MKIQLINNKVSFKNDIQNINNKKLAKRNFIESNVADLSNACDAMCIGTLGTGLFNTDELGKIQKPSIWCKGFMAATIGLFLIKCIKQIKLSKEYDKENC